MKTTSKRRVIIIGDSHIGAQLEYAMFKAASADIHHNLEVFDIKTVEEMEEPSMKAVYQLNPIILEDFWGKLDIVPDYPDSPTNPYVRNKNFKKRCK